MTTYVMDHGTGAPTRALSHSARERIHGWMVVVAAMLLAVAIASPARADFGFVQASPPTQSVTLSTTQAGAHPDLTVNFALNLNANGVPDGFPRDIVVALPPGISGNATAAPRCTEDQVEKHECPASTQVGVMTPTVIMGTFPLSMLEPVYNMVPPPGYAAEFGVNLFLTNIFMKVKVSSADFGLVTVTPDIATLAPIVSTNLTLWGVPSDSSHDADRHEPFQSGVSVPTVPKALLTNGFDCSTVPTATFKADPWSDPGNFVTDTYDMQPFTGCDRVPQPQPQLEVQPTSGSAGQPAGYDITLRIPQNEDGHGIDVPPLKRVEIALPEGVAISPSGADGLGACKASEVHYGKDDPVDCPDSSKLGTVSIVTPDLSEPLTGFLYLGESTATTKFPLILVAQADGAVIKLPGKADPDPATGRLTTVFDGTPPLPFSELKIRLKGGPRAVLSNPASCGTYTSTAKVTPYGSDTEAVDLGTFDITSGPSGGSCTSGQSFAPALTAGVANAVAGRSSAFTFHLTRGDGDQPFSKITGVKLPDGLLASLNGVGMCPADAVAAAASHAGVAELAAPSCPASSRIGAVRVGSGPGTNPLYLSGSVYLTGPYNGAPFGLAIVVPAVAGPIDLGTAVTRASVDVNRSTTALGIDTDALPTILGGVPLQLRDIMLTIDRTGFMVNPTSCAQQHVAATVTSTAGAVANLSSRFQLGDCQALPFAPRLAMALTGAKETGRNGHPGLTADVSLSAGQANLRQVRVALPPTVSVDLANVGGACKADDAAKGVCLTSAIVGHATADTPILPHRLEGNVYLVEGRKTDPKTGKTIASLPRLWVPLRGDIAVDLWADTDVQGRVITTFSNIPDAPISAFHLEIAGGAKGILTNGKSLCSATQTARREVDGQNGKTSDATLVVATPCPLRILSKHVSGRRLSVRVGGLSAGRLSLAVPGSRVAVRRVSGAQVATISVLMSARTQRRVNAGRLTATVRFRSVGASQTKTARTVVRRR
jgi:hypothetical protein